MKAMHYALTSALVLVAGAAHAQTATPQPMAPAPTMQPAIAAPSTEFAVLRTGTEVPLKLSEMLTTKGKKLKPGQRVHLEVANDVVVNSVVVIPAGTPAMGEITEVRNKGMWGKSGHLTGRVLYATVNGRQLRMTGVFDDKGTAGGIGAVATSVVLIPVAGFFMTGTSAKMDMGTPVKAFMDEDVQLTMAATAPAPMVVGTPVAAPPAATPAPTTTTIAAASAVPVGAAVKTPTPAGAATQPAKK